MQAQQQYPTTLGKTPFAAGGMVYKYSTTPSAMPQNKPVVFVVDDDISVRDSLELLINFAGWQPETFASPDAELPRTRRFSSRH